MHVCVRGCVRACVRMHFSGAKLWREDVLRYRMMCQELSLNTLLNHINNPCGVVVSDEETGPGRLGDPPSQGSNSWLWS